MNANCIAATLALAWLTAGSAAAEDVRFKDRCLEDLVAQVPGILASQDRETGRFGAAPWIVNDQHAMLPLAVAWSFPHPRNPYHRSAGVLEAVMAAGDALIADQDEDGRWVFRKKDGSTWGKIYMPWTYSRWIRAYALVREAMPEARRAAWARALGLGYAGIAKELQSARVHNIPAHHAMGLWFAGEALGEPAWKRQASDFLRTVAAAQRPEGYWSENKGPVIVYGYVYVDALGVYHAASKDASVLPALSRSGTFHTYFTYPDGISVETVDERNYYHPIARAPGVGFSFTPEGRAFLARQLRVWRGRLPADEAAALLLMGEEGESAADPTQADFDYVLGDGEAAVRRRGPWYLVVSAITAPVPNSRWIQDRQNFVSVYHEAAGVVLGGGNTKLQPGWSTFTVGDTALLRHRPGDEDPGFQPPPGLRHVPDAARLLGGGALGVELTFGAAKGQVRLEVKGPDRLEYRVSGDPSLTAHVVSVMRLEPADSFARRYQLNVGPLGTAGAEPAARPTVQLHLPARATVRWPVLPHDPYRKDGRADPADGRMVVDVPLAEPQALVLELRR